MKKFLFAIAAVTALIFSGCSKDEGLESDNGIVGSWAVVGYRTMENGKLDVDNEGEGVIVTFKADGTCVDNGAVPVHATWKKSGNTLYMSYPGEGTVEFTILKLTSTDLVLRIEFDSKNWEEMICVRI